MVDVSKYIERADQEVKRKNYAEAMALYRQILDIDPDCGEARAGIRHAALKKHEKRYPSGLERGVLNLPAAIGLGLARIFKAHGWAVGLCEGALGRDPRNPKLNHRLGHALLALGHMKSAEAAFRVVTEFDTKDAESLKILGQLYADRKEFEKAIECFERALKINPRDQEAGKMRKNLAAEGAIRQGGYEQARSARELAKSDRQLQEAERAQKIVRTSEDLDSAIQDARADLERAADDPKLLLRLGTLCQQKQDWDGAEAALKKLLERAPDHAEALDRIGDVKLGRLENSLKEAETEARQGEEGADDRVRRLKKQLADLRLEEMRRRVAAHPTDAGLRFRLGKELLERGQPDEAIEHLQQSVKDPKHRVASLQMLGRAFAGKGILDLAIKQYSEAAEKIAGMTDQRKEILYELAGVHERNGSSPDALAIFKTILEADFNYRDVRGRIDRLSAT